MAWFMANWREVVLAVLAIDTALMPLFPKAGILGSIKNALSGIASKQS